MNHLLEIILQIQLQNNDNDFDQSIWDFLYLKASLGSFMRHIRKLSQ